MKNVRLTQLNLTPESYATLACEGEVTQDGVHVVLPKAPKWLEEKLLLHDSQFTWSDIIDRWLRDEATDEELQRWNDESQ